MARRILSLGTVLRFQYFDKLCCRQIFRTAHWLEDGIHAPVRSHQWKVRIKIPSLEQSKGIEFIHIPSCNTCVLRLAVAVETAESHMLAEWFGLPSAYVQQT